MESDILYRAMVNDSGDKVLINLKLDPWEREEFRLACKLRGASMSGLLHQYIVQTIRAERALNPDAFVAAADRWHEQREGIAISHADAADKMVRIPARKDKKLNAKEPRKFPGRRRA